MGGLFENNNQQSKLNINKDVVINIISAMLGIMWISMMFFIAIFAIQPATSGLALIMLGIISWAFLVAISVLALHKIFENLSSKILKR